MNDMRAAIVPKSDQLNADDLLTGSITIKITAVTVRGGQEQPVAISYDGDNGKPYKPCKSMCRVMVSAWGADSSKYVGKSMTLYCDPKVKWAGMEVGGIRISHMSDIPETLTMALTATKGNKKPFTVKPLVAGGKGSAPPLSGNGSPPVDGAASEGGAAITFEQAFALAELLEKKSIPSAKLLAAASKSLSKTIEKIDDLPASFYHRATDWIEAHK